jgi:hypothetical protein
MLLAEKIVPIAAKLFGFNTFKFRFVFLWFYLYGNYKHQCVAGAFC